MDNVLTGEQAAAILAEKQPDQPADRWFNSGTKLQGNAWIRTMYNTGTMLNVGVTLDGEVISLSESCGKIGG